MNANRNQARSYVSVRVSAHHKVPAAGVRWRLTPYTQHLLFLLCVDLNNRVCHLLAGRDHQLVRCLGGDVHDVARANLLAHAVFNRRAADFVRRSGFRIYHRPANDQRSFAGLDDENVALRFVQLGFAVALSVDHAQCVIAVAAQGLRCNLFGVDFRGELVFITLQLGAFPLGESRWIGCGQPRRRPFL